VYIHPFDVRPGDTVSAFVAYSGKYGVVQLMNARTFQIFTTIVAKPKDAILPGATAEWVVEDPGGGEPFSALPLFIEVTFTNAHADNSEVSPNVWTDPSSATVVANIPYSGSDSTSLTSVLPGRDTVTIFCPPSLGKS
jgi:Peptidase A4 family